MADKDTEKISKAAVDGKLDKFGITTKSLLIGGSIVAAIALIIILSLFQAGFSTEKLKTAEYWTGLGLSIAICIFGMISGMQMGDDRGRNDKTRQYRKSLGAYSLVMQKVESLKIYGYISDWLEIYRAQKLKKKIEMALMDNGINQFEVLDLSFSELSKLKEPGYCKDWSDTSFRDKYFDEKSGLSRTIFVDYTDEQIDLIRRVKNGEIVVSQLPMSFFVDAFTKSEKDMWESAANSEKKKGLFLSSQYGYKLIMLVSISILLTGLEPSLNENFQLNEILLSMGSRLFTLITSIVWGHTTGLELVKIDTTYLDYKRQMMTQYLEDYENKRFIPVTVEEKARIKYEEKNPNLEVTKNGRTEKQIDVEDRVLG